MVLEDIGFYTLTDERARSASHETSLKRCELLLTQRCNYRCPYCRRAGGDDLSFDNAYSVVKLWALHGLDAIRFSGGEPTMMPYLLNLILFTSNLGIERIAISTNGSASPDLYRSLVMAGANDFSVSLDACCAAGDEQMTGGAKMFERVTANIRLLSKLTYVTVGIVLTDENQSQAEQIVKFAADLGVADIRLIPVAQSCRLDAKDAPLFPVLNYRLQNMQSGRPVRGLREHDNNRCPLVLDDMAVCGGQHYACIIHLREGGRPIGKLGMAVREERLRWAEQHDTHADPICSKNCLDVCADYNNRWRAFHA